MNENDKLEILKFLYSERMLDIRQRKGFDFKLVYSYAAMNLVVAGALNLNPISGTYIQLSVIAMLFFISASVSILIFLNTKRHKVVGESLRAISSALGLYEGGFYVSGRSIDSDDMQTHITWEAVYHILIWVFFIAQATIICVGIDSSIPN